MLFDPIRPQKKLVPTKIDTAITVDGILNEAAWSSVEGFDDFVEINPIQGRTPRQRTIMKVAYNETALYFAAVCMDSGGAKSLRVPDFKRDFIPPEHDHLGIIIDGFRDERNAMAFLFNPFGVQRDVLCFDDRFFDVEWDALWRVRTQRTDTAWVAEVAIPWKTLRYPSPSDNFQTWGINFSRLRRSNNEYYSWSPFPRAVTLTRMAYEGLMDSLQVPKIGTNIRVQPYALVSTTKSSVSSQWNTQIKTGGEIKWGLSSSKVLDVTVNTDFAQADVDQQVNNVQRFSYYFPEKRQFFLENASLLKPGLDVNPDGNKGTLMVIQPFFSRRIGLDYRGQPLPIQIGARYIERSEKHNIGLMSLRQGQTDSAAAIDYFIGRYTRRLGSGNSLGLLVTSALNEQAAFSEKKGYTNWSGSLDGFFRFSNRFEMNGMLSGTVNSGKRGRGLAGYVQGYYKSDLLIAWWNQSFVTTGYQPEVGFTNRNNVVSTSPGFYFMFRDKKWLPKFARSFAPGVKSDIIQTANTGKVEEVNIATYPVWFNFNNGGYFGLAWKYQYQRLYQDFSPLNTLIKSGAYKFHQFHFFFNTDQSKKWSAGSEYLLGGFYNGRLHYSIIMTRYAPIPHLSFKASVEQYKLKQVGLIKSSNDYYLYSLQTSLSLSPRLQTFFIYQKNTSEKTDGFNARLSWEYRPLSYVFFVFNNRTWQESNIKDRANNGIFKFSYLKQF